MHPTYTLFQIIRTLWTRIEARKVLEILATQYPQVLQEIVNEHDVLRAEPEPRTPAWMHELAAHVKEGQLKAPIKLIRERTGWGLEEAKDVMDNMRYGRESEYVYDKEAHAERLARFPKTIQIAVRAAELSHRPY